MKSSEKSSIIYIESEERNETSQKNLTEGCDLHKKWRKTMKYIEMLNYVIENVTDEAVVEAATKAKGTYEKSQVTRKAYTAKKAEEKRAAKAEVLEKALAVLGDEPKTATEIVEALAAEGIEVTRQAIPPLFKAALEEGRVTKEAFKIEGTKGKVIGYKRA